VLIKFNWKRIPVFITIACFGLISFSQLTDYKKIFGSDWEKAEAFVTKNETWMKYLSEKYSVSYPMAVAVIFPELVRYSALRDKMEITLLKALYINLGEDYANFSIGQFQMKPSFAESVHQRVLLLKGRFRNQLLEKAHYNDIKEYRSSIVKDLEQPESQFIYLIAFIKICGNIYLLDEMNKEDRLRFLATAYNYSFEKSFDDVKNMTDKKFFYTTLVKTESYSYADISAFWYNNYKKN
jgi:hypothetical protein